MTATPTRAAEDRGEGVRRGGCLCGAVRYRVALPPLWVAHCHCSMCRRAQGAGFVTWVGMDERHFVLETGSDVLATYRSSAAGRRSFCTRCGSPLFFRGERWPGQVHITLASFDDAAGLEPQAHAYWKSRAAWADWSGSELPKAEPEEQGGG